MCVRFWKRRGCGRDPTSIYIREYDSYEMMSKRNISQLERDRETSFYHHNWWQIGNELFTLPKCFFGKIIGFPQFPTPLWSR